MVIFMEIKEGYVKFDKPTVEVNIWIEKGNKFLHKREKAFVVTTKQDSLGRVYITVR